MTAGLLARGMLRNVWESPGNTFVWKNYEIVGSFKFTKLENLENLGIF